MSLYPTKTRLALMDGIDRREVVGYPAFESMAVEYHWDGSGGGQKVTGRVVELMRAEWAERGEPQFYGPTAPFRVRLTDAGRKVLEASR